MVKRLTFLVLLSVSLQGCFTFSYFYFDKVQKLDFFMIVGGGSLDKLQRFKHVVFLDSTQISGHLGGAFVLDSDCNTPRLEFPEDKSYLYIYGAAFCNALYSGGDVFMCKNSLRKEAVFTSTLVDEVTGEIYVVDRSKVNIQAHKKTTVEVQVFLGSDKEEAAKRCKHHFDWNKAKSYYSKELQDSIYYYAQFFYED